MSRRIVSKALENLLLLGIAFGSAQYAYAGLIEVNSPFESNTAFVDTNSGLTWLDLSITSNTNRNEVMAKIQTESAFAGYRYASLGEVEDMLAGIGLQFTTNEVADLSQYNLLDQFLLLMGIPSEMPCCGGADVRAVYGLTSTLAPSPNPDDPAEFYWGSYLRSKSRFLGPVNTYYRASWVEPQATRFRSDQSPPGGASWLVRRVPEPSTIGLGLLGLLILLNVRPRSLRE